MVDKVVIDQDNGVNNGETRNVNGVNIPRELGELRVDSVLGEGGFGCIFKGSIDEHSLIACKHWNRHGYCCKEASSRKFPGSSGMVGEINYLGQSYHSNLVKLIGYCLEDEHWLLVAFDATKGLAYLYNDKAKVIYKDFKSSNILLDSSYRAKLYEFGLANE
ncbi:unnamed protein product [Dovyalis caffra]|uniref:Protein kinase domain-containing protein n=1 Tax=Dovyalis caffra TaxID=77055 RepID=A0AAV1SME3_9ROSI|nr:unnamed protein product [Dovyalis caffra]